MARNSRNKENKATSIDVNVIALSGVVTFINDKSDKVLSFGVKCTYDDNGKTFSTYPIVKAFYSRIDDAGSKILDDMDKGTHVNMECHLATSKYTDKNGKDVFTTDLILDNIELAND